MTMAATQPGMSSTAAIQVRRDVRLGRGAPHFGHAAAFELMSAPHSLHLMTAMGGEV